MASVLDSPLIVGGTGGSGTRAVQMILEKAGVFMGDNNNDTRDSLDFAPVLQAEIPRVLAHVRHLDYELTDLPTALVADIRAKLAARAAHAAARVPEGAAHWGWKNPRSIYLLPFFHALYPSMRFVQVVRDGRDMALSTNLTQMRLHYAQIFGRPVGHPPQTSAVELWNRVNTDAARWGVSRLGDRYHVVRFEDLCHASEAAIAALLEWLGIAMAGLDLRSLTACVVPPQSLSRWRSLDENTRQMLERAGAEGLRRFGYA